MDISILIVNYNTAHLLDELFSSLYASAESIGAMEIMLVDNASSDNSVELIKARYPDVKLIVNKQNVGFGRANNQMVPFVKGRYILLLNTDAFVDVDALRKTMLYMDAHMKCAALGVKLTGRDGVIQPSCRYFPTPLNIFLLSTGLNRYFPLVQMVDDVKWDQRVTQTCDWVPGCYLLIRRDVVDTIGLFDSRYFLYYEEVDWCFAAKKAGWEIHYFSETTAIHLGGESAKSDNEITSAGKQVEALQIESELLYFRKNHGVLVLLLDVFLHVTSDAINIAKCIVRNSRDRNQMQYGRHARLMWKIARETSWGLKSTK